MKKAVAFVISTGVTLVLATGQFTNGTPWAHTIVVNSTSSRASAHRDCMCSYTDVRPTTTRANSTRSMQTKRERFVLCELCSRFGTATKYTVGNVPAINMEIIKCTYNILYVHIVSTAHTHKKSNSRAFGALRSVSEMRVKTKHGTMSGLWRRLMCEPHTTFISINSNTAKQQYKHKHKTR